MLPKVKAEAPAAEVGVQKRTAIASMGVDPVGAGSDAARAAIRAARWALAPTAELRASRSMNGAVVIAKARPSRTQ